jgi:tetratricopeptide (TPR) repeat protein
MARNGDLLLKIKELEQKKQYDEIIALISLETLKGDAENKLRNKKAWAFYNKARMSYTDGKYEEGERYLNEALELRPGFGPFYNGLGNIYDASDKKDKALIAYGKAIQYDSNEYGYFVNRAITYDKMGKLDEAIEDYQKVIQLTNDKPEDYYRLYAQDKIIKLKKLVDDEHYRKLLKIVDDSGIKEMIEEIKQLLLFKGTYVTHYTSISTAKKLILERSAFQLSEGAFLNDTSEGRELFKYLNFHPHTTHPTKDTEAKAFAQKPFIGSFVADNKQDDLTLWRTYGKDNKEEAKGCAITINTDDIVDDLKKVLLSDNSENTSNIEAELRFYRVAYRTQNNKKPFVIPDAKGEEIKLNKAIKKLENKIQQVISSTKNKVDIATINKSILEHLNAIAYLFKSSEYQYEHELRLVVSGSGFVKNFSTDGTFPRVYIDLVDVTPMVKKITLGPKVDRPDELAAIFYYTFEKDGFRPEIFISHLPFK